MHRCVAETSRGPPVCSILKASRPNRPPPRNLLHCYNPPIFSHHQLIIIIIILKINHCTKRVSCSDTSRSSINFPSPPGKKKKKKKLQTQTTVREICGRLYYSKNSTLLNPWLPTWFMFLVFVKICENNLQFTRHPWIIADKKWAK